MRKNGFYVFIFFVFSSCITIKDTTIPENTINFESFNGIPVITIVINKVPLKMAIDTGANDEELSIKPDIIEKLKLTKVHNIEKRSLDIAGNNYQKSVFVSSEVKIEGMLFKDILVSEEKRVIPFDGIIGNEFFKKNNALFVDYTNNLVCFSFRIENIGQANNWKKIDFEVNKAGILLQLTIDGNVFNFILDTGMSAIIDNKLFAMMNRNERTEIFSKGSNTFIINNALVGNYKVKPLNFTYYTFPDIFPADGLLGYNILRNKKIVIDFDKNLLYVWNGVFKNIF
jgi:hypothetical protein